MGTPQQVLKNVNGSEFIFTIYTLFLRANGWLALI